MICTFFKLCSVSVQHRLFSTALEHLHWVKGRLADSDEVAQAFRNDVARRYEMMPPGIRCLAGR
jgi:hypothetical protein